jgi:protein-disulfide isomerase
MTPVENDEQDLTRKQRREQARAERKAAEQAVAADAARRRRLSMLGGAVAVVVVAIVVILIATSGGGSKTGPVKKGSATEHNTIALVNSEIGGIPQSGNAIGSPTAPVTLQYFGDLECPICREFTEGALTKLIEKDVRAGKLRVEYRSMETATREPETFKNQQIAALAAGKQNKMWNFLETFYHEQGEENSGYVTEKYLQGIAQQVPGLNLSTWQSARADTGLQAQLAADTQESNNQGFNGTPSFLIGHSGGAMKKLEASEYGSLQEPSGFEEAVSKASA